MLFNLMFVVCLAAGAGLAVYIAVDEKMQARPWRFLVPAFVALLCGFALQVSYETLASTLSKISPGEDHLAEIRASLPLVNNVIGAFAGALIGAAVAIRASQLNAKRLRELEDSLQYYEKLLQQLVGIRDHLLLPDNLLPAEVRASLDTHFLYRHCHLDQRDGNAVGLTGLL